MSFLKSVQTHMDFVGQKRAEKIFQYLIVIFAIVGFAWGFYADQFMYTLATLGAGFVVASLIVLPPWPFYRQNPLKWQKVRPAVSEHQPDEGEHVSSAEASPVVTKRSKRKQKE